MDSSRRNTLANFLDLKPVTLPSVGDGEVAANEHISNPLMHANRQRKDSSSTLTVLIDGARKTITDAAVAHEVASLNRSPCDTWNDCASPRSRHTSGLHRHQSAHACGYFETHSTNAMLTVPPTFRRSSSYAYGAAENVNSSSSTPVAVDAGDSIRLRKLGHYDVDSGLKLDLIASDSSTYEEVSIISDERKSYSNVAEVPPIQPYSTISDIVKNYFAMVTAASPCAILQYPDMAITAQFNETGLLTYWNPLAYLTMPAQQLGCSLVSGSTSAPLMWARRSGPSADRSSDYSDADSDGAVSVCSACRFPLAELSTEAQAVELQRALQTLKSKQRNKSRSANLRRSGAVTPDCHMPQGRQHPPKFDVTHVYDGLLDSSDPSIELLQRSKSHTTSPPANSPSSSLYHWNAGASVDGFRRALYYSTGVSCLRQSSTPATRSEKYTNPVCSKPLSKNDDTYYCVEANALEKRLRHQEANLMAPVSF